MAQELGEDPDDAALRARLGQLSSKLETRESTRKPPVPEAGDTKFGNAMGLAFRAVTELIAGVVVGGGAGYLLDKWLNTKPVLLLICLVLGVIGGFWNIVRSALLPSNRTNKTR